MGWIISFGLESLILIIEAGHNLRMLKNLVVTSRRAVSVTRPSLIFSNVCMRRLSFSKHISSVEIILKRVRQIQKRSHLRNSKA